jgi:gentisate 1,2-dioxygenase
MTAMLPADLSKVGSLDELYPSLDAMSISAGWHKPKPSLWAEPRKNFLPMHWSWSQAKQALDAAGRLINTEQASRRNLLLFNAVEGNTYATVRTLVSAYQMIMPGERAPSHRHSGHALRVVLEGEGAFTVVEGERLDMHPNDVVLTPDWHWHGHGSDGNSPCYWIDGLDTPLVHLMEPMFLDWHPSGLEPTRISPKKSPFIFAWTDTQAALDKSPIDPEGRHGRRVELGKPAMSTIALYMQRHDGGTMTRRMQTTANQIFFVIEGRGTTDIDGQTFSWGRGDVIAVPCWRPFHHHVASDATLFSMTDEPILRACGRLRVRDI